MPLTRDMVILKRQGSHFLFEFTVLELTDKIAATKHNWSLFAHLIPLLGMIYRKKESILVGNVILQIMQHPWLLFRAECPCSLTS